MDIHYGELPLHEKCPNTEFFLYYLSVFSPNAGKYRPEKTPYLDTFHHNPIHPWLTAELKLITFALEKVFLVTTMFMTHA